MKPTNSNTEDMFEKAREAFFGTAMTSTKPKDSSTEPLKPRNESSSQQSR